MSEQQEQLNNLELVETNQKPQKNKDKLKFNKTFKIKKHNHQSNKQIYVPFNDPLYQYLDNEVLNKQQHNFGPWIQSEKKITRQKLQRSRNQMIIDPMPQYHLQRPQQNEFLYQSQVGDHLVFPAIIQRNKISSLQQIKHSSIELQLQSAFDNSPLRINRDSHMHNKSQFFTKMHGLTMHKLRPLQITNKKSTFNYNYCVVQENQHQSLLKNKLALIKQNRYKAEAYLKLSSEALNKLTHLQNKINQIEIGGRTNNQKLMQELKRHRLNKLK